MRRAWTSPAIAALRVLGLALVSAAILAPPALDLFGAEPPLEDFLSFHFAALDLRGHPGASAWDIGELRRVAAEHGFRGRLYPYLYPPTLAWTWMPFAGLPLSAAKRAWVVASIVAASLACAFVGSTSHDARRALRATVAASVLVVLANWRGNLVAGQANALVACCLALAGAAVLRGRDVSAGVAIGLAAALKITPAVLIAHFVVRRRWRAVIAFVATLGAIVLASIAAGRGADWSAFAAAGPRMAHGETIEGLFPPEVVFNVSIAGAVARFVHGAATIRAVTWAVLTILGILALARSHRAPRGPAELAPLAALSCLLVLGSPFGYWHHALMIVPAAAWVWSWADRSQGWVVPVVTALLGIVAIELPAVFHALGVDRPDPWIASAGTWLYLLLFAALLAWRPRVHVGTPGHAEPPPTLASRGSAQ